MTTAPTPYFQGVPEYLPDEKQHRKRMAKVINTLNQGKFNATINITLNPNATTTVVNDARIAYTSHISWMPLTADAATAGPSIYVSSQNTGTLTLTHASNAAADQNFRLAIIG